jgi:hypothetical protein
MKIKADLTTLTTAKITTHLKEPQKRFSTNQLQHELLALKRKRNTF